MKTHPKQPAKSQPAPRLQTLPRGSYRFMEGPQSAVIVREPVTAKREPAPWNETDWVLMLHDALWEKASSAYYEGLDGGFALGLERGRREAQEAASNFRQALEVLETNLLQYYSGVEQWSVRLALSIAEKVVEQAAQQHTDLVRDTVHRAIGELADKSRILLRVHPADFEAMKAMRGEFTTQSEGREHFKIEADARVTPGSCQVETPMALLDADFSTQLGELRHALIPLEEAHS